MELPTEVKSKIETALNEKSICLFMKGTPAFPQCGFSQRAVALLNEVEAEFHAVNILEDQEVREGIKIYGNWPTIPQLYVKGELVGGSDILMEMYQEGELADLVKDAQA
ncbi:MAG: Grx4 family monothiol glutaredoxin [Bdellovibrionales bacterium]